MASQAKFSWTVRGPESGQNGLADHLPSRPDSASVRPRPALLAVGGHSPTVAPEPGPNTLREQDFAGDSDASTARCQALVYRATAMVFAKYFGRDLGESRSQNPTGSNAGNGGGVDAEAASPGN